METTVDFDHTTRIPLSDAEAKAEAERIIAAAYQPETPIPTSFRDDTPLPKYGITPPVPQDDRRIVPAWAAGIAVASIGVGVGITGVGCGAWLVLQGLASVTLYGVLLVTLPFAGVAMVATAIGGAINRARSSVTKNVYEGPVVQNTNINNTSHQRGMFARTRNDIRRPPVALPRIRPPPPPARGFGCGTGRPAFARSTAHPHTTFRPRSCPMPSHDNIPGQRRHGVFAVVDQPIRSYIAAHSAPLQISASTVYTVWQAVGLFG
jgi:hypothetical protein